MHSLHFQRLSARPRISALVAIVARRPPHSAGLRAREKCGRSRLRHQCRAFSASQPGSLPAHSIPRHPKSAGGHTPALHTPPPFIHPSTLPYFILHPSFFIHYSPFTIHYSPTLHTPLHTTILHSSSFILHSLFTLHYSLFSRPCFRVFSHLRFSASPLFRVCSRRGRMLFHTLMGNIMLDLSFENVCALGLCCFLDFSDGVQPG